MTLLSSQSLYFYSNDVIPDFMDDDDDNKPRAFEDDRDISTVDNILNALSPDAVNDVSAFAYDVRILSKHLPFLPARSPPQSCSPARVCATDPT